MLNSSKSKSIELTRPCSAWSYDEAKLSKDKKTRKQKANISSNKTSKDSWNIVKKWRQNKQSQKNSNETEGEIVHLSIKDSNETDTSNFKNSWTSQNKSRTRKKSISFSEGLNFINNYEDGHNSDNENSNDEEIIVYPISNPKKVQDGECQFQNITILSSDESEETSEHTSTPSKQSNKGRKINKSKRKSKKERTKKESTSEVIYFSSDPDKDVKEDSDFLYDLPWLPNEYNPQICGDVIVNDEINLWQLINILGHEKLANNTALIDVRRYDEFESGKYRLTGSRHFTEFSSNDDITEDIIIIIRGAIGEEKKIEFLKFKIKLIHTIDSSDLDKASYLLWTKCEQWLPLTVFYKGSLIWAYNHMDDIKSKLNCLTSVIDVIITSEIQLNDVEMNTSRGVKIIGISESQIRKEENLLNLLKSIHKTRVLVLMDNQEMAQLITTSILMIQKRIRRDDAAFVIRYIRGENGILNLRACFNITLDNLEKHLFGKLDLKSNHNYQKKHQKKGNNYFFDDYIPSTLR